MASPDITSVSSDHADPATLPTTTAGGSGSPLSVSVFTLHGQPDVDPLALSNGAIINESTALSIPAFYSGVRFISETIAGLPKHVYQRTPEGPKRLDSHPMEWSLNQEANALSTPYTVWSTFMLHAINWSNGYLAIKREPGGDTELFNVPPDRMTPFRFNAQQFFAYDTEQPSNPANPNSRYLIFSADEIIHLPALSFDGMTGLRMVRLMQGTLRTAKNTESYVGRYYAQGGLLGGVVESDQKLTKEQIQEYGDVITNRFSGVDQAHKWMILGNGAKAKTLSPELDTSQTEENRKFSVLEICRMLRVPPHIVYELGRATWANIESLGIEVVKYTLNNWITPLEQELTRKLLTRQERKNGCYIRFDVSALLRGDHAAQIDAAVKRTQNGLTTPDEERAVWELPPYPDGTGSKPRVPANTVSLAQPTPAPIPQPEPAPDPQDTEGLSRKPSLTDFAAIIADAAERVGTKTTKATEAAQKKHYGNAAAFTAWGNVFAGEQERYAAEAVEPILATFAAMGGTSAPTHAKVGQTYARELRKHLSALNRGEQSKPPHLAEVIFKAGDSQ